MTLTLKVCNFLYNFFIFVLVYKSLCNDYLEKIKSKSSETIKIKKEKVDSPKKKDINVLDNKEKTPDLLPPVSKRLDDDAESIEVPKFIGKYIIH